MGNPNLILRALSVVYGTVVSFRNELYDRNLFETYTSSLPVISIGNIIVGGSGKSPFAQYLAAGLASRGKKPVILLRGYRGSNRGPHHVSAVDDACEVGDEAVMHFRGLNGIANVVVARKRVEGAQLIEQKKLGDVILLDDGLQHRALNRTINFLLFDCAKRAEIESDLLIPAGELRERKSSVRSRIHAVVAAEKEEECETSLTGFETLPFFKAHFFLNGFYDPVSGDAIGDITGREVVLFSAIARPESFREMVRRSGALIRSEMHLADHSRLSESRWRDLLDSTKLPIVMTEKDAARFANLPSGRIIVSKLGCTVTPELDLWQMIEPAIKDVVRP